MQQTSRISSRKITILGLASLIRLFVFLIFQNPFKSKINNLSTDNMANKWFEKRKNISEVTIISEFSIQLF